MKYQLYILIAVFFTLFLGCKKDSEQVKELDEASEIIDLSYKASGSAKLGNSIVDFDFRDKHYRAQRNKGKFTLIRSYYDSIGNVVDELNNNNFSRSINGTLVPTLDSMANKYKESINSVHYFSVLPFGLKDPAVNSKYLGKANINDQDYNKIKVYFDQEGGGQDFEDVFVYWINTKTNLIDYLAYSFNVNGGGMRFREAFNERFIDDIRFVDYKNYKPINDNIELFDLDKAFVNGELDLLSTIELKNVTLN